MVLQPGKMTGRWHGLSEQQRHFGLPVLRVGKKEDDNFSSVASLYTESILAEWRWIKDIQLLAGREGKNCC